MKPRLIALAALVALTGLLVLGAGPVQAQEQFFTQSGGHGLQNARMNARMSKNENDVAGLQAEMAKVKPHAKQDILECNGDGNKLRYDGTKWVCTQETDPTVQGWAKEALPSCGGGQILSASGGHFGCANTGFLSQETDPTVQAWAKTALPSCAAGQVLTVQNGNLSCQQDQVGVTAEKDPNVFAFARNDQGFALPNCNASEDLTMVNGRLACRLDIVGLTQESDPHVAAFARNDIAGYTLTACAAGEVLKAETSGSNVILKCEGAGAALTESLYLNDLKDVSTAGETSSSILGYNGTEWVARNELDPTVMSWAKANLNACAAGQVLSFNGTNLTCVNDAGGSNAPLALSGLSDVNVAGVTTGAFLKYNGTKWVPGTVQQFAQDALPVCGTGQILTTSGATLVCVNDAGGAADPSALADLKDVQLSGQTAGQLLRYNGTKWVNTADKVSALTATKWCHASNDGLSVICDTDVPLTCASNEVLKWNGTTWTCTNAATGLGFGTMAQQNANDVSITGGFINGTTIGNTQAAPGNFTNLAAVTGAFGGVAVTGDLHVGGNFSVSGSQTIDGVTFANGGIQSPGGISANRLDVANISATQNVSVTGLLTAGSLATGNLTAASTTLGNLGVVGDSNFGGNVHVNGNLSVSGSQTIDGVTFENGGVQTSRLDTNNVSVTQNVSVTGNVTANNFKGSFTGDGSGLTGLSATGFNAAGVSGSLQYRGAMGEISGSNLLVFDPATAGLTVAGMITASSATLGGLVVTGNITAGSLNGTVIGNTNPVSGTFTGLNATTLVANTASFGGAAVAGDLHVGGNFSVSGSQTIDGVTFAKGGVQTSGTITSSQMSTGRLDVGDISASRNVSVTGNVTAANFAGSFTGDGSGLTNLNANGFNAAGVSGSIQYKGLSGEISGSSLLVFNPATAGLTIAGSITATSGTLSSLVINNGLSVANVSVTQNVTINGALTAGSLNGTVIGNINPVSGTFTGLNATNLVASLGTFGGALVTGDLHVGGNFSVSGSQTIDGVTFANGGVQTSGTVTSGQMNATNVSVTQNVSVTGNVTAANFKGSFTGDGSQLTNLPAGSVKAAGVSGSIQYKGALGEISGSNALVFDASNTNVAVTGSLQLAADPAAVGCGGAGDSGKIRYHDNGGGDVRLQVCRPW